VLKFDTNGVPWYKAGRSGSDNCVEVAAIDGMIVIRNSREPDGPTLEYTRDEWRAFVDGARDGDFDNFMS
jgi:hypothetical protein